MNIASKSNKLLDVSANSAKINLRVKKSPRGNFMRHTESKSLHTDVYYAGQVKTFWGLNHRRRALDFFHSLPKKQVEIAK